MQNYFINILSYKSSNVKIINTNQKISAKLAFIKLEGQIEAEKSEIKIIENQVEYKHKIINDQNQIETEKDTIEKIEIEK